MLAKFLNKRSRKYMRDHAATTGFQRIEDAANDVLTQTLARMQSQDFDAHAIFAKRLP
ncbi:hypothetical protein [Agarivorans sp.]|uniref:hypothetical protein n=1 Tax=Agarivorans sp. TaxID=1872412 RepID=UPI003D07B2B0